MAKRIRDCLLILLAGGRSSRMGRPKGLLPFRGRPWILGQLLAFQKAGGRKVLLVLGYQHRQYFQHLPGLESALGQPARRGRLQVAAVINPRPRYGPFSSLRQAVVFLRRSMKIGNGGPADSRKNLSPQKPGGRTDSFYRFPGVFVLPVDVPCPGPEVWEMMAQAMHPGVEAVVPRFGCRRGHPVLLSSDFFFRLAQVPLTSPQARLDRQIRSLPRARAVTVAVADPRVCWNLNTPEAYQAYRAAVENRSGFHSPASPKKRRKGP